MSEIQPELMTRLQEVAHAIDDVLVANHGMRWSLKAGHPPFSASLDEGLARYGPGPLFNLWVECRAVEALRLAWTGKPGVQIVTPAQDEPDEAPGLTVEANPADGRTDDQQRLAVGES